MKVKISLAGLPGVGKTQTLMKTIDILEKEGNVVGGILTEKVMDGKESVGLKVLDWHSKTSIIFAHKSINSRIRIGKFGVDLKAFDQVAVPAIEWSKDNADVIVIDEVGKIEQESKPYTEIVKEVLELDKMMILTLHKKGRNPLLQEVKKRDDVRSLEVTQINRTLLPYKIAQLLKGEEV
ncbi:MAG: NTPase [Thermoplasmatales archaeon]|nr:NTPase [Thermoplasmatales archaeon]